MELRQAQSLRRYYRGERARVLRSYRRSRRQGAEARAAQESEKATYLEQQISRVERWIRILEANPGAVGRFSLSAERAQVGRIFWHGRESWRVVGIGWADLWDSAGFPTGYKVAAVQMPLTREVAA